MQAIFPQNRLLSRKNGGAIPSLVIHMHGGCHPVPLGFFVL